MGGERPEIPALDRAGLRRFGLTTGGVVAGLFGLVLPWAFGLAFPTWPWIVGGLLVGWALGAPESLVHVYRPWMRLGLLLNRVTSPIILGLVFFLVITPVAVVMRLLGRDPMARRRDAGARSYRVPSHKPDRESMEKPY